MSGRQPASIRRAFDAAEPFTVGAEEELMLLDPGSGDLAPLVESVLERTDGDPRFKRELPLSQIEILTDPSPSVATLADQLRAARRDLTRLTQEVAGLAASGVHPFASPEGELSDLPRHRKTAAEYGPVARRQLVFALQIHVAPGPADRALAVYNALRSYLPEIAALAANAPFHDGSDTGLASIRPQIAGLLPRQGVPPALTSWEDYEEGLRWGARAGTLPDAGAWWWELRPHPRFGTLELRVPDAQTTVAEASAVAALAQSLVAWLGERADAGDHLTVHPSWRIAENRWRAARDGVEATLADLDAGTRVTVRERVGELLTTLAPTAARLGCEVELGRVADQLRENGAMRQRGIGRERGPQALVEWLAERFLD